MCILISLSVLRCWRSVQPHPKTWAGGVTGKDNKRVEDWRDVREGEVMRRNGMFLHTGLRVSD